MPPMLVLQGIDLRRDPAVSETLYGRFKIFTPERWEDR